MERELRYKVSGILFYLIFIMNAVLTVKGHDFVLRIIDQILNPQANNVPSIVPLVSVLLVGGTALFTSDAIGYLFGSIFVFCWNSFGGERLQWRKIGYDLQSQLSRLNIVDQSHYYKDYKDVVFNYFWQQNPDSIIQWAVRRDTAF